MSCFVFQSLDHGQSSASTTWTAIGAIATAIAAVVAIVTLLALKQDSRDRTRPMLAAYLRHAVLGKNSEFVVQNFGQSVAKNVVVEFDPPLPVLEGADANGRLVAYLQRRYSAPIPTFVPGFQMENYYKSAVEEDEPVPDDFSVVLRYEDTRGRKYLDKFDLTTATLRNQTASYPGDKGPEGYQKRSAKALEAIARAIGRH